MVDIKTLRIGSHVAICGGERVKVTAIRSNGIVTTTLGDMDEKNLSPIPITPALLEELGLINISSSRRIIFVNGNEDDNPWIEFKNLKDRWKLFVCNEGWQGQTVVRYLHEAEAFLVLHGVELINE